MENFMDSLAPPSSPIDFSHLPSLKDWNQDNIFNSLFSMEGLQWVMNKVRDSTPGLDNISYSMISHLPLSIKKNILLFFNDILFGSSSIPLDWCKFKMILILKPDKEPSLYSSYRLTALSSCFRQIFEHLIKNRLDWWIEKNNILDDRQFGFRRGRFIYLHNVRFRNKTAAIFLDLVSAYDKVITIILFQELLRLKIDIKFAKLIFHLISCKYNFPPTK